MGRNYYQPDDDGRRWQGQRIGYHRGSWHGPYRRRNRWPKRSENRDYRVVVAVLALFGAIALGAVFLVVMRLLFELSR